MVLSTEGTQGTSNDDENDMWSTLRDSPTAGERNSTPIPSAARNARRAAHNGRTASRRVL